MTCAQGLLRLLWGGAKLECYGTELENKSLVNFLVLVHSKFLSVFLLIYSCEFYCLILIDWIDNSSRKVLAVRP